MLYQLCRDPQRTHEQIEALIALGTEHGFPFYLALSAGLHGWVLTEQGEEEAGIAQMREGLVTFQASGATFFRPYWLALLAKAYGNRGQTEEGLNIVDEALAIVDTGEERFYEVELWRLKGELTLQCKVQNVKGKIADLQAETEDCLHRAVAIARTQSAKSLELRAVMSLSRLWQQQGKKKHARKLLTDVYGWFTEGFDTVDLQEAKTLLDELS